MQENILTNPVIDRKFRELENWFEDNGFSVSDYVKWMAYECTISHKVAFPRDWQKIMHAFVDAMGNITK